MKKILLVAMMSVVCGFAVRGAETEESPVWFPIGLSLIAHPMQIPTSSHSLTGVMLNVGYGKMDNCYLLDVGIGNNVSDLMVGFEVGVGNYAKTSAGFQIGLANIAGDAYGFQLGLVNVAESLHGFQVGLVNVNSSGTPFFPIINIGF